MSGKQYQQEQFVDIIRPTVDDDDVMIPISFEYNGGRRENSRLPIFLAWAGGFALLGLVLFTLFGESERGIFARLILAIVFSYVGALIIRYPLLKEGILRRGYQKLDDSDHVLDDHLFWSIADIEPERHHAAHFENGSIGVFIYLEKDVVIGKRPLDEFEHFEAIANAMNVAHYYKARLLHLDYMTAVGKDERFVHLYEELSKCTNPVLKRDLSMLYSHLEKRLENEVSTYDVYLILVPNTEHRYTQIADKVLARLLKANYVGYRYLDEREVADLVSDIFGISGFSSKIAQESIAKNAIDLIARPIRLTRGNKYKRLGLTLAEEEAERQRIAKEAELVKLEQRKMREEVKKARKSGTPTPSQKVDL